jgi:hypothetical protein
MYRWTRVSALGIAKRSLNHMKDRASQKYETNPNSPLLNWVTFSILNAYPTPKKRNEPKSGTAALGCGHLLQPEGMSKLLPFPIYLFTFCTNEPNFKIIPFTLTSHMEIAYDIQPSTGTQKNEANSNPF